jgi:hypothetical protein
MEDLNWLRAVYDQLETSQTLAGRQFHGDFPNAIRDEIDFYFLETGIKRDRKVHWTVGKDFHAVPPDLNRDFGGALPDESFQDDLGLPCTNCGEESA